MLACRVMVFKLSTTPLTTWPTFSSEPHTAFCRQPWSTSKLYWVDCRGEHWIYYGKATRFMPFQFSFSLLVLVPHTITLIRMAMTNCHCFSQALHQLEKNEEISSTFTWCSKPLYLPSVFLELLRGQHCRSVLCNLECWRKVSHSRTAQVPFWESSSMTCGPCQWD